MDLFSSEFKRKFSVSMYKNLKLKLGEMTFFKDFISDTLGDLYPVISKSEDCAESIEDNRYILRSGSVKRLFCQFFPFATYEITAELTDGEVGFCFKLADAEAAVTIADNKIIYAAGDRREQVDLPTCAKAEHTLIVSCRPGAFDIYRKDHGMPEHRCTFYDDAFRESNAHSRFSDGCAALFVSKNAVVSEVLSYIDNGISIADIRPIKYEDGKPLREAGMIFFTASVRMWEGAFGGVFSWIPGTDEFRMTGALFYDCGDGKWRNYLAPVILYHREKKQWYAWVSSFEHEHILAYSAFDGDPRFGVNAVDVKIMEKASDTADISVFAGFKGDEDPDLFYDEENGRWLMAICRLNPRTKQYVYVFFESEDPFRGYTYIGQGYDGAETGGSFVKLGGQLFFVCGNDFAKRSEYRIYGKNGMQTARFDHPDGGFRGWGTVIPVEAGSRTRYFWLTFDRQNGSKYNWSYGNLYCFEADM